MKPTVVIGLGSLLMSDEGIGVQVVQALLDRQPLPPEAEVLDLGTGGLTVLHALAGRSKAVFVDCGFMDEPAGTLRRFTPDDVVSRKVQTRLSLHEGDLLSTLDLARSMDQCPDEVVIFAIQPSVVEPGLALSPVLSEQLESYVDAVRAELAATPLPGACP